MRIEHLSKSILETICNYFSYSSIKYLAEEHNLSSRQIYYQIDKINAWLNFNGFSALEYVKGKGYYCLEAEQVLEKLMIFSEFDLFLPNDLRFKFIYCSIYSEVIPIGIEDLCERAEVSRNTIISDLKQLSSDLEKYDISLSYTPKIGYYFEGNPILIRTVFIKYFNELGYGIHSVFVNNDYLTLLKEVETAGGVKYVEGILDSLSAMIERMKTEKIDLHVKEILYSDLYSIIQEKFDFLDKENQLYLYLHLLSSRRQDYFIAMPEDRTLAQIKAKELIEEFERLSLVLIPNREAILRDLSYHFSISFYRYRYGIQIGNPLTKQIKEKYSHLFELITRASQVIEYPLNDDEIAYITTIFGGNLVQQKQTVKQGKRIVVICPNGLATSKLICREITKINPSVKLTISSVNEFQENAEEYELVVATVPIDTTLPTIYVSPILTDLNKQELTKHLNPRHAQMMDFFKDIKEALKQHKVYSKCLANDIYEILFSDLPQPIVDINILSLLDLLDDDNVLINPPFESYSELLENLNDILIQRGSSSEQYLQEIYSLIEKYKTSMFISEDIFLAHGPIVEGNDLDIALATIPQGVEIEGRTARLILFLVIEDVESHLQILKDIVKINDCCLEELIHAQDIEQIINLLLTHSPRLN